jgi:protein TonB
MSRRWPETVRWGACFAIALGVHVGGAAALLARWHETSDLVANAPVITIDLAPVAVAPQITPTEVPPDVVESKQQIEPDPTPEKPPEITEIEPEPEPEKPVETAEVEPLPTPEPELAMLPPPKPPELEKPVEKKKEVKKKRRHRVASVASAPSAADRKAERAAAPMPGASARNNRALPSWTSELVARLERYKRYPSEAQSRGDRGVVRLAFSVDRGGGVHHVRIVRSSGSQLLDRETLAMVQRAAPLPPPPEGLGSQVAIVVPIRYNIR